jgi:hypothetical protein
MPESGTRTADGSMLLLIVRDPVCWPALAGAKVSVAVQLAPVARCETQVVSVTWNPEDALTPKSGRTTALEFVTVTSCVLLTVPTPVAENFSSDG